MLATIVVGLCLAGGAAYEAYKAKKADILENQGFFPAIKKDGNFKDTVGSILAEQAAAAPAPSEAARESGRQDRQNRRDGDGAQPAAVIPPVSDEKAAATATISNPNIDLEDLKRVRTGERG
jgi:hypothetical protein